MIFVVVHHYDVLVFDLLSVIFGRSIGQLLDMLELVLLPFLDFFAAGWRSFLCIATFILQSISLRYFCLSVLAYELYTRSDILFGSLMKFYFLGGRFQLFVGLFDEDIVHALLVVSVKVGLSGILPSPVNFSEFFLVSVTFRDFIHIGSALTKQ